MEYIDYIKDLSNEELIDFVNIRIKELEEESTIDNGDNKTIGYNLGYELKKEVLTKDNNISLDLRCFHNGYINKNTRIVFALAYDTAGYISNDGKYYYVDDDTYILDFCKFIKNKEIINEYELFDYILIFIKEYFGDNPKILSINNNEIKREDMFKMLYQNIHSFYKPVTEHGLSWFKNKGNALCSEYAVVSNNIMNFLGIRSFVVAGNEKTGNEKSEGHAYNLITYIDSETGKKINALIDFANYVKVFNTKFEKIGESPFIGKLNDLDEDLFNDMMDNNKHLIFDDYILVDYDTMIGCLTYNRKRDYFIDKSIKLTTQEKTSIPKIKKRSLQ